jgi:hypothetical protein
MYSPMDELQAAFYLTVLQVVLLLKDAPMCRTAL